jgi:D-alanyl-D-alanine carboxypeptidase
MAVLASLALEGSAALAVVAPTRAAVQGALRQLVAAGAPGASAVIQGPRGAEHYAAGLADIRGNTPIGARDHFRIGSVTKSFVATVVLQLVAAGRLSLTDSVERWLPGLVPNGSQITIRELLNHTSGIADYCSLPHYPTICSPRGRAMTRRWSQRQLVQIGAAATPTFPPGKGWKYSNTGCVLLGMIVERVTGHPLATEFIVADRLIAGAVVRNRRPPRRSRPPIALGD